MQEKQEKPKEGGAAILCWVKAEHLEHAGASKWSWKWEMFIGLAG